MISYTIELQYENRPQGGIPLSARSDNGALRQFQKWFTSAKISHGCNVYLAFHRSGDGQHGYINRDGASPIGKKWNLSPHS